MKFTIQKNEIANCIHNAAAIAERRQTIPILANLKIKAESRILEIISTDLEVQLKSRPKHAEIEEEGEVTVSARKMSELCRSLKDDEKLNFALNDGKLHVSSANFNADFATLSANDFPELEVKHEKDPVSLDSSLLKRLLTKTSFSMASQDVRYYLNGLLLEFSGKALKAVATDGHRMAVASLDELEHMEHETKYILPRKAVIELSKILSPEKEKIEILLNDSHLTINSKDQVFSSKLIEGRFPDYQKVFPDGEENSLLVEKETLQSALSRSSVLSSEKYRGVRFSLKKNLLTLTANNPEQELAEEEIDVVFSGPDLEIGFNINYILDALNVIESKKVEMLFYGEESSCLIREPENTHEVYVVMPMRL